MSSGAPWWAFMVTAAFAVVAVIIANASSNARERESWRREQLLAEILLALSDSRIIYEKIGTISTINVEMDDAIARKIKVQERITLLTEIGRIIKSFSSHTDLISVMASPSFTSSVIRYYAMAATTLAEVTLLAGGHTNNKDEILELGKKLAGERTFMKNNSVKELQIPGPRSRLREYRMRRFINKTRTAPKNSK